MRQKVRKLIERIEKLEAENAQLKGRVNALELAQRNPSIPVQIPSPWIPANPYPYPWHEPYITWETIDCKSIPIVGEFEYQGYRYKVSIKDSYLQAVN